MTTLRDVDVLPRGRQLQLRPLPPHARPGRADELALVPEPTTRAAESWVEAATGLRIRAHRTRRGRFSRTGSVNLGAVMLTPAEGFAVTAEAVPGMPDLWVVAAVPQEMFVARPFVATAGADGDGTQNAGFWVNLGVGIGKALSGIVKGFADLFPKLQRKRQRVAQQQAEWQSEQDAREQARADDQENQRIVDLVEALNARNADARQAIEAEAASGTSGCARCRGVGSGSSGCARCREAAWGSSGCARCGGACGGRDGLA